MFHNTPHTPANRLARLPYWLLAALLMGVLLLWNILTDADYALIFAAVVKGVWVTSYVCLIAFAFALLIGLIFGLARLSHSRFVQEVATFYVEIIRGVPMLVILYYIALGKGQ